MSIADARLVNEPIRDGKFGEFWTLESFDLEEEDATVVKAKKDDELNGLVMEPGAG